MATKKVENKGLLGKIKGVKEAYGEHKSDKTTFSSTGELPAGIENGIAELIELTVDEYKNGKLKGEPYFKAVGLVRYPKTHKDGTKVAGRRTMIMEPLCETPGRTRDSVDSHVEWMLNELRKLGMDTDSIPFEKLEQVMAAYAESEVLFRFRTWSGEPTEKYPDPIVNHQWNGVLEEGEELPEDFHDKEGVQDETSTETEEEPVKEEPKKRKTKKEEPAKEEVSEESGEDEPKDQSLQALAQQAEEGDKKAQAKLFEIGLEKGLTEDQLEEAESWDEVVALIEGETGESTSDEEETVVPEKGSVFMYHPISKTTGKPLSKGVECEVTKVNTKEGIVDLKNLTDQKKTYKSVPFDKLVPIE